MVSPYAINLIAYVVTVCSVIGSSLLLFQFVKRPSLRSRILLRPLMYEALSQFIRALGLLIENSPLVFNKKPMNEVNPHFCSFLGGLDQFTNVCCYGWYSAIAFNAILALRASVERPAFTQRDRRLRVVIIEGWVVFIAATIATIPPLVQGTFGNISDDGFEEYDCWIENSSNVPPVGQFLNFFSFLIACIMGVALLLSLISNKDRMADFNSTLRQTVVFTGVFLVLWLLQHINDFYQTLHRGHHSPHNIWYQLNEILKGVGGIVIFLTWYPSRTMNTEFDDIENPVSIDTYNQLRPHGYCTESEDEFEKSSNRSNKSSNRSKIGRSEFDEDSTHSSIFDDIAQENPDPLFTAGDTTTKLI